LARLGLADGFVHARSLGEADSTAQRRVDRKPQPGAAGSIGVGRVARAAPDGYTLAAMALQHAVPAIFQDGTFAAAGGMMDYGGNFAEPHRLAGTYTGRILKGEKPADLPVQQATKVELIINLKTAKTLGVTVPLSLLGRADQVIE
jgi:putative tryptophan/tyrosine transport system substrate-binding protein